MLRLTIPGELPGLNKIIATSKSHYGQYAKLKKDYTEAIVWLAKGKRKLERVDVVCVWYSKNRRRDPDNISAGIKFILDGLVEAGVLDNDGQRQIASIRHEFRVDKHKPRVEVVLKEVE